MFDWQTVIAGLMILGALVYVARRAVTRLSSFRAAKAGANACETGCGSCAGSKTSPAVPLKTIVQIERTSIKVQSSKFKVQGSKSEGVLEP